MYSKAREKGIERYVTIIMIGLAIASFAITAMVAISPESVSYTHLPGKLRLLTLEMQNKKK